MKTLDYDIFEKSSSQLGLERCYNCGRVLEFKCVELKGIFQKNPKFCTKNCRGIWIFNMIRKGQGYG